jgi:hypothetical protein
MGSIYVAIPGATVFRVEQEWGGARHLPLNTWHLGVEQVEKYSALQRGQRVIV